MSKVKKGGRLPISVSRKFILSDKTQFVIKEAYKTARANLVFSLAPFESKIVVVTSCAPAEGKSTNCLNLAITMAETGASVLLIDADMRKPVQHSLLRLDNKKGLSSILGGITSDVGEAITKNVRDNLSVITSGPIPPNPAELLSSKRMSELMGIVGKYYDYVFIDTPPVTVVTDAFLMNETVSGMVFVVKEGYTTHVEIGEALQKAKMTNAKVLGFIKANCNYKGKSGYSSYRYKYRYNYEGN